MLVALTFGTSYLAQQAAEREALSEARTLHSILVAALATPGITDGLVDGDVGDLDRLDRLIRERFLENDGLDVILLGINVWTDDGRLVYSDELEFLGRRYDLRPEQRRILAQGGTGDIVVNDADARAELPRGRGPDAPVQVFTQITTKNGTPLLFEGFYALDNLQERREEIYTPFRWISIAGMVTLLLLVTPIIWVLTRDVRRAGLERERLLQAGIDASDAERRRIARDLHDGVVQDLAGASFGLAALARTETLPPAMRHRMSEANSSLRDSLKALRALLSEIHPPEIQADVLPAALADLTAPAAAQGVRASVAVDGFDAASDTHASLVWRVAQEAVRNSLRHAHATTLDVHVRGESGVLVLEVVDDGLGFDPAAPPSPDRYGLTAMRSLARDRGGELRVDSTPGAGTAVRLEIRLDD